MHVLMWEHNDSSISFKDFNDLSLTSGGWTTQIIIDTTNWFVDSFGGDDFAKCTNYNSGNVPANTWLISPGVDLSSSTQPILNLNHYEVARCTTCSIYIY